MWKLLISVINNLRYEAEVWYIRSIEIKDGRSLPFIAQEDLRQIAIEAALHSKKQVEVAERLNVTS